MAAKIFRINYKSDFILTLNSDAGWMTPFCIKFWTGAPSQAFFVGWDGTTYTHCSYDPSEPTKLVVQFDDHHLPTGDLKFQIAYHFTVADFQNDTEDEVINPANITTEIDGETYQVMLDFTGETAPEIQFSLPAYANEAQRIANEQQRIANEEQRIADEQTRIDNETLRISAEQTRQDNEAQRIRNEQTRISQEEARVREFATLKRDAQEATTAANDAAALANQKAQLAADRAQLASDKAALAQDAATLANEKAQLAADKAALANDAAALANEKAAFAQLKAEYAKDQGDYAKQQGDYAKEQGDYAKRKGDDAAAQMQQQAQAFSEAQAARQTAYEQAEGTESGSEAGDGSRWGTFKANEAARDAKVDAKVADITNLQKAVAEGAVYDISANHLTEGVPTKYADLTAALGTDGVNVPVDKRKGGMSIKYIQSSDNKYVQYRLMSDTFNTTVANWQGVDEEPTAGSRNLVESGGILDNTIEIAAKTIQCVDIHNVTLDFIDNGFIRSDNTISSNDSYKYIQNVDISNYLQFTINFKAESAAATLLLDEEDNIIKVFQNYTQGLVINRLMYPKAVKASFSSKKLYPSSNALINVYELKDYNIHEYIKNHINFGDVYSHELSKNILILPQIKTGGYYSSLGVFRSNDSSLYIEDLQPIPYGATKIYYTGRSFSNANGGVLFYDSESNIIDYYESGTTAVTEAEVVIPNGAVFYKASSYQAPFAISFDVETKSINEVLDEVADCQTDIDSLQDLQNDITNIISHKDVSVKNPEGTIDVETAATHGSGLGIVFTNKYKYNAETISFYAESAGTTFKIIIGSFNSTELVYTIDKIYDIESAFAVGYNSIDISSYNIILQPNALVICTACTTYYRHWGDEVLLSRLSYDVGTYDYTGTQFSGYTAQFVIIGHRDKVILPSNVLYGKSYVAIGDSFTDNIGSEVIEEGPLAGKSKVYPYIIANRNDMEVLNQGASGSTLSQYIIGERYNQIPSNVDYITIWYGINDAGHNIPVGTIDDEPEDITTEAGSTTCGAFNFMLKWCLTNRPMAHIGVIVTDFTTELRREAIIACCQKWGVSYLDLYDPTVPMIRTRGGRQFPCDTNISQSGYVTVCQEALDLRKNAFSIDPSTSNIHPNNDAHEYQSTFIEDFMRRI